MNIFDMRRHKLIRRSSQIILIRQTSRHATLIRTYSLPASFYSRKQNR